MNLEKYTMEKLLIRTSYIDAWRIYLPEFAEACEGEKLVILANDEYSVFILPFDVVQERINTLRSNGLAENVINNLYTSIIDVVECKNIEGICFEYNSIFESFLDEEVKESKEPLVFQNINGKLKMYFSTNAFKESTYKNTRRRG